MTGLWSTSGSSGFSKVQFHHSGLLHVHAWAWCGQLRVWAGPAASENHSVPTARSLQNCLRVPFPNAPICFSYWSHRMTVTNSILLAEQMLSISGKRTHRSFSGMNGGRGGSFLFRLSSIPSRAPQQWASCHPSRRELPCPQDPVGAFGLTWSYQAEINWAEYLWPCLWGRAVSGCAQFRKLIKRRERSRNRCSWVVCVHAHARNRKQLNFVYPSFLRGLDKF